MKIILTAFLLFVNLMIQAQTTYYIDPAGNNDNNGSISSPWLTLTYACAHAINSGDVIHINAGTYTETVQSVLAVGVSIEGTGVTSVIRSQVGGSSFTISLFSSAEGTNGNQHISNIKMDGNALVAYGAIRVINRSNVEIFNCTLVDFNYFGVQYVNGNGRPSKYATGNKFHDNTVTNCSAYIGTYPGGDSKGSLFIGGQDGLLIYNNTITQNRAGGANGNIIDAVEGYLKNVKVYNNTMSKTFASRVTWDFAIELWNCLGGIEIYKNVINGSIDVAGPNNNKGSSTYSVWIHDNIIGQATLLAFENIRGILIESTSTDVIVERNYIKNVCAGIYFSQVQSARNVENIRISYNIFDNIGVSDAGSDQKGWGINWTSEDTHNHTVNNINIWNNVFIGSTGARSNMWGINLPNIGTAKNVSIRNNIIENFDYCSIFSNDDSGIATIDYLSLENNIFYNNGYNNLPRYSEITPTHNTTQNNLTSNPLFVSSSDFHLQAGSPAINKGIHIENLLTDYEENTVGNSPEIGAYEFINSDNLPPSIEDQGFQLNENSPDGTVIGTVVASDPDAGQTIIYSIVSGNTNVAFAIDAITGVLSVANSTALSNDFSLVIKVKDNGVGELSSQATIAIDVIPTGIELTGNNSIIKVYPNPVANELIIEFIGNNDRLSFNILNSVGQIVFNDNLIEKTIVKTTDFSPGIYFMKIENRMSFEFRKIVKV